MKFLVVFSKPLQIFKMEAPSKEELNFRDIQGVNPQILEEEEAKHFYYFIRNTISKWKKWDRSLLLDYIEPSEEEEEDAEEGDGYLTEEQAAEFVEELHRRAKK